MTATKRPFAVFLMLALGCVSFYLNADTRPVFDITANRTSFILSKKGSARINFTVRNMSGRTLLIDEVFNVVDNSSVLSSSFIMNNCLTQLANRDICSVTSLVKSKGLEATTTLDLQVCVFHGTICSGMKSKVSVAISKDDNSPHPFPSPPHPLISHVYIVNILNSQIITCEVNNVDGRFYNCHSGRGRQPFGIPLNIAFNSDKTRVYITDLLLGFVHNCMVKINGDINYGSCKQAGPGFTEPYGIALNKAGTIAYITEKIGGGPPDSFVRRCTVNPKTGAFDTCVDSGQGLIFSTPKFLAFDESEDNLYVSNTFANQVLRCPIIAGGKLGACVDAAAAAGLNMPSATKIINNTSRIYIVDEGNSRLLRCNILSTGNFDECTTIGPMVAASALSFLSAEDGHFIYFAITASDEMFRCPVNLNNGDLLRCVKLDVKGIGAVTQIVLR